MTKDIIKQVLIEQQEEVEGVFQNKIIPRDNLSTAKKLLRSDLIKVITGVRRCGKSTLCHDLLKDVEYGYINFDDERLIGVKAGNLNDFIEVLHEMHGDMRFLLLDEVQNVEGWELLVNRLRRSGYNICITGSNSKLLSKELATHLTGRHLTLELYPFSFREFLSYNDVKWNDPAQMTTREKASIKQWLKQYLQYGGLPEVIKIESKWHYLQELYDRIVTRDIILRYNIKRVRDLKEIALFSISNFASKISYHKVRNIFEIKSVHTVKNYINYLEEAYLLFQLNTFSFKLKEQIKLPKKIYCIDTGILNAVVPKSAPDHGRILENAVFLELKRKGKDLYFYSKDAYEVDFIIREGFKAKQLIQVSYSVSQEEARKREIRSLLKASEELSCRNLLIITWDEEGEEKVDRRAIKITSFWKWLLTTSPQESQN